MHNRFLFYSCIKCREEHRTSNFQQHSNMCYGCLYPKPARIFICKQCGIEHKSYQKRTFCGLSCSAIYLNKARGESGWEISKESKKKISVTLKSKPRKEIIIYDFKDYKIDNYTKAPYSPVKTCDNCGKYFLKIKYSNNCSDECSHEIRSRKARARSNGVLTKRSKLEVELHDLCELSFPNVTSNIKMFDGWDADILLNDHKVAILWNGPWHYREMNFGNHSLKQVQNRDRIKTKIFNDNGWAVEVFEDRHFTPQSAHDALVIKYMQ